MSIFDFNSLAETVYKGAIPHPDWVLCPEGEYPLQCSKLTGREVEGRRVPGTFLFLEIQWEILDDDVKRACNMDHCYVSQDFSLATVLGPDGRPTNQLDLGPNQNMALKGVWKACGILTNPTISKIRQQTAWGSVKHEIMQDRDGPLTDIDGNPIQRARVVRVAPLEAGRRRAQQATPTPGEAQGNGGRRREA
jgi:hypothetical protein